MNNIESIIERVRQLRDADHHVCEYDLWQQHGEPDVDTVPVCSCLKYDQVIDKLRALSGTAGKAWDRLGGEEVEE